VLTHLPRYSTQTTTHFAITSLPVFLRHAPQVPHTQVNMCQDPHDHLRPVAASADCCFTASESHCSRTWSTLYLPSLGGLPLSVCSKLHRTFLFPTLNRDQRTCDEEHLSYTYSTYSQTSCSLFPAVVCLHYRKFCICTRASAL
jgi:hypothetical protein